MNCCQFFLCQIFLIGNRVFAAFGHWTQVHVGLCILHVGGCLTFQTNRYVCFRVFWAHSNIVLHFFRFLQGPSKLVFPIEKSKKGRSHLKNKIKVFSHLLLSRRFHLQKSDLFGPRTIKHSGRVEKKELVQFSFILLENASWNWDKRQSGCSTHLLLKSGF